MANPFLSHLLDRLHSDLEFLKSERLLDSSDVQFIRSKLDAIPQTQARNNLGGVENGLGALQLEQRQPSRASSAVPNLGQCRAVWNYTKSQPDDLGFQQGDIIDIIEETNQDWYKGSLNGQVGLFPSNHVERIQSSNTDRAPPPPPPASSQSHNNVPYNAGYSQPAQYAYQQPQYYSQPPNNNNEKQSWQPPPPPPPQQWAPPPPPPQNVVVSPAASMSEEEKKKKFPGGKFGKQVGTAFAGGMGFGAGSAITSNAINAIF